MPAPPRPPPSVAPDDARRAASSEPQPPLQLPQSSRSCFSPIARRPTTNRPRTPVLRRHRRRRRPSRHREYIVMPRNGRQRPASTTAPHITPQSGQPPRLPRLPRLRPRKRHPPPHPRLSLPPRPRPHRPRPRAQHQAPLRPPNPRRRSGSPRWARRPRRRESAQSTRRRPLARPVTLPRSSRPSRRLEPDHSYAQPRTGGRDQLGISPSPVNSACASSSETSGGGRIRSDPTS